MMDNKFTIDILVGNEQKINMEAFENKDRRD